MGGVLGAVLQRLSSSRRRVVARNLQLAFPERDNQWRATVAQQSYENLAISLFETTHLWFRQPQWLDDYVAINGLDKLQRCVAAGEAVMIVSCHYLAIEVAGAALCRAIPFYPVYASAKNPYFDAFQQAKRLRFAPDVVHRADMRKAMRVLRSGGLLWLLPDQAVDASHGSVPTQFFKQPVLSSTGPARLLKKSKAKYALFEVARTGDQLTLTLQDPVAVPSDIDAAEFAQLLNDKFEQMVRKSPGEYFWHHKRFKSPNSTVYHR